MSSQTVATAQPEVLSSANTLTLLTFNVAGQTYGLPVASVVRIIEMVTIKRLPAADNLIEGIINLHGKAVPVIDLRQRLGLPRKDYGLHTPIILSDLNGDGRMLGLIVDAVEDVLRIPCESFQTTDMIVPTELVGQTAITAAHLAGAAKIDRRMIIVFNVGALLTPTEQTKLSETLAIRD